MQAVADNNEAVRVSVPVLVRLSRHAASIPLLSNRIRSRQAGNYQSPFKGRGMEFDESRLYQPGDDIRNIDWRVTARTGKTHTKLFREERERPVFLWIDLRAPMFFATRGKFKAVLAGQLASLLAWSAIGHGDRVGGVIFSDTVHHELKPQRGKAGVLKLIHQLAGHPAWDGTGAGSLERSAGARALLHLRRVVRPGSLIFLLSDFRNLDSTAETHLIHLSRNNDVIMIDIHDPLEQALPHAGRYRVSNGREELVVDTYDKNRVAAYRQRYVQHREWLSQLARRNNIYLLACATTDDPLAVLQAGLALRTRR